MGAWGYKECDSDEGSDRYADYLYYAKENNSIIDVDYTLKRYDEWLKSKSDEEKKRHGDDYVTYYESCKKYVTEVNCIVMCELIHFFKTNTYLNEIGHYDDMGYSEITKIVGRRKTLEYILKVIMTYKKDNLASYEKSGWSDREIYTQRTNWIKEIVRTLDYILRTSKEDTILIFDKETAEVPVYIYPKSIELTDNHDLNRLRLYIENEVNRSRHKERGIFYYEAEAYKNKEGKTCYKLIYHDYEGKVEEILRAPTIEKLIWAASELGDKEHMLFWENEDYQAWIKEYKTIDGYYDNDRMTEIDYLCELKDNLQRFYKFHYDEDRFKKLYNKENYINYLKKIGK